VTQIHSKDAFGDFKDIFISILEDSSYECLILANVSVLLDEDAFGESCILYKQRLVPFPSDNINLVENKPSSSTPAITVPAQAPAVPSNTGAPPATPAGPSSQNETVIIDRLDLMQPEEVKVSVLQIFRKLQELIGTEVAPDKKIKVGQELVQSLIPSMANYQAGHVSKTPLYDAQTSIQLVKRRHNDQGVVTAKRGELSEADTLAFFPKSQLPISS